MSGIAIIIKGADYSNKGLGRVHLTIIPITGINISSSSVVIDKDTSTLQLSAALAPNNTTQRGVAWSSSNTNVATIDNNGLITVANRPSTDTAVVFTATSTSNPNVSDSISITVKAAAEVEYFTPVMWYDTTLERAEPGYESLAYMVAVRDQNDKSDYTKHIRACMLAKNATEHLDWGKIKFIIESGTRYRTEDEFKQAFIDDGVEVAAVKGVRQVKFLVDMTKLNAKGIVGCSFGVLDFETKKLLNTWKWWTESLTVDISDDSDYSVNKQYALIANFKSNATGVTYEDGKLITALPEIGVDFSIEIVK